LERVVRALRSNRDREILALTVSNGARASELLGDGATAELNSLSPAPADGRLHLVDLGMPLFTDWTISTLSWKPSSSKPKSAPRASRRDWRCSRTARSPTRTPDASQ
jgi:hypothetical protein